MKIIDVVIRLTNFFYIILIEYYLNNMLAKILIIIKIHKFLKILCYSFPNWISQQIKIFCKTEALTYLVCMKLQNVVYFDSYVLTENENKSGHCCVVIYMIHNILNWRKRGKQ